MTDIPRIDEFIASHMPDGHWIDRHGREVWIKKHKRHRVDGPAIIHLDGSVSWCFNGHSYLEFEEWLEVNDEITDEQRVMLKLEYG